MKMYDKEYQGIDRGVHGWGTLNLPLIIWARAMCTLVALG